MMKAAATREATLKRCCKTAPDPKARRHLKTGVEIGLAVFAAGVLALLYLRTL